MKKPAKNIKSATSQTTDLRKRAEKVVRGKPARSSKEHEVLSPAKTRQTLHDLQVHQIELEMQNEEMRRAQAELETARARYFDLYDLAPVGYCTTSEQGLILEANLTASTLLGMIRDKLVSQPLTRFILKEDQDIYYLRRKHLLNSGEPQEYELRMVKKDGTVFWAHLEETAVKDEDGAMVFRIALNDITRLKQAESNLEALLDTLRREQLFSKSVLDNLPGIFYLYTYPEKRLVLWNKQHETILGFNSGEIKDRHVTDWFAPENRDAVLSAIEGVMEKGQDSLEAPLLAKDGHLIPFFLPGVRFEADGRSYFMGIGMDITERKTVEKALQQSEHRYLELSIIDDLTKLYNSRHFYSELEREIERSNRYEQPLTLLLLDLDKFKDFNDTYGHVQGDYVLFRLGNAIKRSLRETDSAYRYGGEEFTIILPMTTSEEGIVNAKRIQKEFRQEIFSPELGQEIHMTVSIGLAQYKPHEEIKAFVHRVDQFMYKVKKNGRGKICSDDGDVQ